MNRLDGLAAQVRSDCRVLVLGSMPGDASLSQARYYAHPRNRFWPLMERLCGVDSSLPYPERLERLHDAGIGLWDVIAHCRRTGSLDAAIERESIEVVPLAAVIGQWPALRMIACNGAMAASLFQRHLWPSVQAVRPDLTVVAFPSTSPANASHSLDRLQARWEVLLPALAP